MLVHDCTVCCDIKATQGCTALRTPKVCDLAAVSLLLDMSLTTAAAHMPAPLTHVLGACAQLCWGWSYEIRHVQ